MEKYYHLLYPIRTCLITSKYRGKNNVMAASWVFPLSMDPPCFGISIAKNRFSYELISKGKFFGINLPHAKLESATIICGTNSGRDMDKFEKADLTIEETNHVPLVKDCPTSIVCEVVNEIETGDHVLFVGKVVSVIKRFKAKGLYQVAGGGFTNI